MYIYLFIFSYLVWDWGHKWHCSRYSWLCVQESLAGQNQGHRSARCKASSPPAINVVSDFALLLSILSFSSFSFFCPFLSCPLIIFIFFSMFHHRISYNVDIISNALLMMIPKSVQIIMQPQDHTSFWEHEAQCAP